MAPSFDEKILVRERLNIYFLLNTSVSMHGVKINQLNTFMKEMIPHLNEDAIDNNIEIWIRAIEFGYSETAKWFIGDMVNGVPIEYFVWNALQANGNFAPIVSAIEMLMDALSPEYLGIRAMGHIIVLISDGKYTDKHLEYHNACVALKNKLKRWGNYCLGTDCVAIGVKDYLNSELEEFATRFGGEPLVFDVQKIKGLGQCIPLRYVDAVPSNDRDFSGIIDTDWDDIIVSENETIIQVLRKIKDKHDEEIFTDAVRFSSIIRDLLPGDNLERVRECLIAAIEKGAYNRLEKANQSGSIVLEISVLTDVLYKQRGFDNALAKEAVECLSTLFINATI